jgi:thymidylate synthase
MEQIKRPILPAPILNINPDVKSFYDFTMDDFELVGYEPHDSIKFEVAI